MIFVVGLVAKWISSHRLSNTELIVVALSAGATFILLDLYSPHYKVDNTK